jgi:hypothetical protein
MLSLRLNPRRGACRPRWPSDTQGRKPANDLETLRAFRIAQLDRFERCADALFDLGEAFVASDAVDLLPSLNLQAVHRHSRCLTIP